MKKQPLIRRGVSMKRERIKVIQDMVQCLSFFVLIVLVLFIMEDIQKIQGTARVINYTGIVGASAQRVIKLELAGSEEKELIDYVGNIMEELKTGGTEFRLIQLKDELYQQKLDELLLYWPVVNNQIKLGREIGWGNTQIIEVSEKFYRLTNRTVRAAEDYIQKVTDRLKVLEVVTIIVMGVFGIGVVIQSIMAVKIISENGKLHQEAYQDPVSGIHNRSYFNHHMQKLVDESLKGTICYIDLDRLKYVNDNFGHDKGDEYIRVFVRFIKNEIRQNDMFCRIGGDEFALVMVGSKEEQVVRKLEDIRKRFIEKEENKYHGSFSYGVVEINESNQSLKLEEILNCADKKMYEYKIQHKAQRK